MLWAEHVAKNTASERDDVFATVRELFTDAELYELTDVCGVFAVSNRFQDTMRLPIEEQGEIDKIKSSIRVDPKRIKAFIEMLIATWPVEFPRAPGARRDGTASAMPDTESGESRPQCMPKPEVARLPCLDPETAPTDSARFLVATRSLLDGVSNAHRIWAHSPHVAKLFFPYQIVLEREGAGSILPMNIKLLAAIRTAHLNAAVYSLAHRSALARAAGMAQTQLAALANDDCVVSPRYSERERAALVWATCIADNTAKKRQDAFDVLKRHYSTAEIVELTGSCAMANRLDLVHNALRVPLERPAEIAALNSAIALDPARIRTYLRTMVSEWPQAFPAGRLD